MGFFLSINFIFNAFPESLGNGKIIISLLRVLAHSVLSIYIHIVLCITSSLYAIHFVLVYYIRMYIYNKLLFIYKNQIRIFNNKLITTIRFYKLRHSFELLTEFEINKIFVHFVRAVTSIAKRNI